MQIELGRIERLAADIDKLRQPFCIPVEGYEMLQGSQQDGNWTDWQLDTPWRELDSHRWFRTQITIAPEFDGKHVVYLLSTGREGQWDATNPQFLFYLDNEIVQGLDVNHHQVTLAKKAEQGRVYHIALLAYSGSVPGDLILHSSLAALDDRVEAFYYDFYVPLTAALLLHQSDPENCRCILGVLSAAADIIDLRKPYSKDFYASLDKAGNVLKKAFYTEEKKNLPVVSAVGHTHIDIAWLWTVAQTKEKVLRSFATALRLMEDYPEYTFMSSQPILYDFVRKQEPAMYEAIKRRIGEGRWEADGAMWLEADCNLPSGESLVRQILKGRQFFMEEFGIESKCLWLPDVFGYSAALPQILKQCGIPYFLTTKISWNQYNQLPNDTFFWKGIDGSQVFVFMPTACDFDRAQGENISFSDRRNTTTYTGIINPNMALGTYHRFQNKNLTKDTLMLYGYGDGGGGPTKEMLENARRLRHGLPGIPRVRLETEGAFFDRIYNEISGKEEMPMWHGELYFEYHRGTYTSMAAIKRGNRKGEVLLNQLEVLSAIGAKAGMAYPRQTLRKCWDLLLLNQFHDIIPGSSIEAVCKEAEADYKTLSQKGNAALQHMAESIAGCITAGEGSIIVFNTLGYERDDIVEINPVPYPVKAVKDCTGNCCDFQYAQNGSLLFYANKIPSAGYKAFTLVPGESHQSEIRPWEGQFENPYYKVAFNDAMEITSLLEKETGKELIKSGQKGNKLTAYEDRPINWDNWDIDIFYKKKPYGMDATAKAAIIEQGPVRTVIQVIHKFMDSTITQDIILYCRIPRIDFRTHALWREHNILLKAGFPVDINATKASYEIQFGNVERETTCNHSWDTAKFEVCGHKWADLSESGAGISLLNDCKYGHSIKNGEMALTLIKSGTYPNENADIGEHQFTYALYPHPGMRDTKTVTMAYNLNYPLLPIFKKATSQYSHYPDAQWNLFQTDSPNCFLETIKEAENGNGLIIRMYENSNAFTKASLNLGVAVKEAYECDLLENNLHHILLGCDNGNCSLALTFQPFEIKTIRIVV